LGLLEISPNQSKKIKVRRAIMNNSVLSIENISKDFIGVHALRDVSLKIREGEIHALLGENGAGKSTLMKIISGAYPHKSYNGKLLLNGKEKYFNSPRDAENVGIEMIYQEINLMPDLNIAENIFIGKYPASKGILNWRAIHQEAKKVLNMINLDLDTKIIVRNLSISNQQMILIAKAVYKNPKILILDEPTSSLAEKEIEALFNILNNLKRKRISCIYISHKIDEVVRIADRISILRDGELIRTIEKEEFDKNEIIELMIGKKLDSVYPKYKVKIGNKILEAKDFSVISKFAKNKKLIDSASFFLREGEILGIAGLLGSGRSELLSAIFGYAFKDKNNSIFIKGNLKTIKNPILAIKNGIGYVTEDRFKTGLIRGMNIRENITIAKLRNLFKFGIINYRREKDSAATYMKKLSIKAANTEVKVNNLSGGNQQKVILSRWLLNDPKILLLDEPTRGIDVGAKYEMYKIMTELKKEGVGIILVTSELIELVGICDRILVLKKGKFIAELEENEITEKSIMRLLAS
jgi:D-xylose transport system ATP-binding protein